MAFRYIDWVGSKIQSARSEAEAEVFAAKKAAYMARTGNINGAARLNDQIKENALRKNLDSVAIYATFVDGIIAFYQDLIDEACDKWTRAKALSKASDARPIRANSCSWLAHHAFGQFDLHGLEQNLSEAFQFVDKDDSECLSRIYLVLAVALHLCGDKALANEWYLKSRGQAMLTGDDATVSAIMYNRAAMDVACFRQKSLRNSAPDADARLVVLEAESVDNFDKLLGVVSLEEFTPILKAQTYSLDGRFLDAEQIYAKGLAREPSSAQRRHRGWLVADRAYCVAKSGSLEMATSLARMALEYVSADVQIDDLAALHSRLSAVYSLTAESSLEHLHASLADECWSQFAELQAGLRSICYKFDSQRD